MHLARGLTTINTKRRKLTKKQIREKADWDDFLKKHGVHPDQLKVKERERRKQGNIQEQRYSLPNLSVPSERDHRKIPSLTTSIGTNNATVKRSVMDPRELAKERPEVQEATLSKSQRIAPLYNKGGYQYVSDEIDITTIGSKSRRG
jgi:hypothetical protein